MLSVNNVMIITEYAFRYSVMRIRIQHVTIHRKNKGYTQLQTLMLEQKTTKFIYSKSTLYLLQNVNFSNSCFFFWFSTASPDKSFI